ncbi:C4-dicarboxylic acid transporter DauA [Methanimicrococcus hongohii]|uniref:C4-dicarboxylic acid transporter DauA n=1 Tax=Methanimicrococcus hongohii TaxID=3028295 RepID=A0AA96UZJ6_9EURY|nr:SulP family inorganic anion transporter [Methanimicrococcus sp. Hf6]WNY23519.1 C4-dicarboxylic acid transporter DauA [Methanimicrococcus sp. Hf6]
MPETHLSKDSVTNYFKNMFVFDLRAGFITAIVALPLSIGFAVASGVDASTGIYTAVIAGFLASLFGGSKYSITGPTGAMSVVVLTAISQYGLEGLFLATVLAGLIQIILGILKVGKIIKFIPLPLVSGFTGGLGLMIIVSQIPNALGLTLPEYESTFEMLVLVLEMIGNTSIVAVLMTLGAILLIRLLPRLTKGKKYLASVPPTIIAILLAMILLVYFGLDIPTVGAIPAKLPTFSFFSINLRLTVNVLPFAFMLALLGTLESLLCAVVCDGMTATKHDSDRELIGQGIAKVVTPFFGGLPATAALSRSTVNIREGAKTRMSGILCAVFLLLIMLFFGRLGAYLPYAVVAGVLFCAALPMINVREFRIMLNYDRIDAAIFGITFILTVFADLILALEVGILMTMIKFMYDMTKSVQIDSIEEYDSADSIEKIRMFQKKFGDKLAIYTINGPFFFGAMNIFDQKVNVHLPEKRQVIIIRMRHVPYVDATATSRLDEFITQRNKENRYVLITGIRPVVKKHLLRDEDFDTHVRNKEVYLFDSTEIAVRYAVNEIFPKFENNK